MIRLEGSSSLFSCSSGLAHGSSARCAADVPVPLTFQNNLLLETLDRVLDKGVVIDRQVWRESSAIDLNGCSVRVVSPPDNDDDGGGNGPAQQMRLA
jgi:hypothetical protein